MSNQKTIFVILSPAKNLALKPPRFVTKLRSVQNDMNFYSFLTATLYYKMGNLTVKVLPWSVPLSTVMVPKCCLMME
jgi:hypothetical protein